MNNIEKYKRIVNSVSSAVVLGVEILCYWIVWVGYYNKIIEFPFWRKGNWLMATVYGVLLLFFLNLYGGLKIGYLKKMNVVFSQILSLLCVNVLTYLQIALLDRGFSNIWPLLWMFVVQLLGVIVWANLFHWIYRVLYPPKRMILVYGERPAFSLMDKINSRGDKYHIEKMIRISAGLGQVLNEIDQSEAVIIGDLPSSDRNQILKYCFGHSIRTYIVPKISDIIIQNADNINLFDTPLMLSRNFGLTIEQQFFKRIMDIVFSLIFIIFFSPVMLISAVLIKLYDGGAVLYTQSRLTRDGKIFEVYKFRSMVMEAEKDGEAVLASKADHRVTPVGKFLRRSRFDELPQFFNILKGDMSIVGPRPERPEIAERYLKSIPEFHYRLKVKAGLTGYAQIYGKYNTVPYDKLKLDLTYVEKFSFWLDFKLIIMTFKVLFMKESTEGVIEE